MKTVSSTEWEAIGTQTKKVKEELYQLLSLSAGKVPMNISRHLATAIEHVENFRCKAEERMLSTRGPEDLTIFYGGNKE